MKVFRHLALESQLEVEKLHEKTKASYAQSEAEVLYDNLKTQQQAQDPQEDEDSESTDAETDPPAEEGAEQDSVGLEELKGLTYATEDFASGWETAADVVSTAAAHLLEAGRYITSLGVEYGPKIASRLYKGVTYVFGKLIKLLVVSTLTLTKYIDRRVHSFERLKSSIQEYRKSLELVQQNQQDKDSQDDVPSYTNVKVINSLKIGQSVDFTANIERLSAFVKDVIEHLDKSISSDVQAIKHLVAMAESGSVTVPKNLTAVKLSSSKFSQGSLAGYDHQDDFTQSYKYNEVLPSDVVLMAVLPKQELTALEDIAKAYSASNMTLGFDSQFFKEVSSVDYMKADDLAGFLDKLELLCDVCIAHQALYEKVMETKKSMKFTFRTYFRSLASSPEKVSLKNSLIEYVYLKSMFVDKVYLVAAMDIHDYSARVISFGLSFVKDNVKRLS